MKKFWAVLTALVLGMGFAVMAPLSASANNISIDCNTAWLEPHRALQNGDHINIDITLNGVKSQVNAYVDRNIEGGWNTFGLRLSTPSGEVKIPLTEAQINSGRLTFNYSSYISGAYVVEWAQFNSNYFNQNRDSGKFLQCGTPERTPINFTWPIVTDETCDAAGTFNPDFTTWARGQNNSYEGAGYRLFISPAYAGPGTYELTVQRIGPNGQPGYPYGTEILINGVKSSGAKTTLTIDPAIGYQTADSTLPCYNRPDTPVKEDRVVKTEEKPNCLTDKVVGNIATTKYTFTWNETTKSFDETEATTNEPTSRDATYEEIVDCNPLPENRSEEKSHIEEDAKCGDTSVVTSTVFTDYTYSRDETGHVTETTNERTVPGVRVLEKDEQKTCTSSTNPLPHMGNDGQLVAGAIGLAAIVLPALAFALRRRFA